MKMIEELKVKVINEILNKIPDPDLGISIYELGLIYEITPTQIEDSGKYKIHVLMTLTSPGCPSAEFMVHSIYGGCYSLDEVEDVDVDITFSPPWTSEMIDPDIKDLLDLESSVNFFEHTNHNN